MNLTDKMIKVSIIKPGKKHLLSSILCYIILVASIIYCATTWWSMRGFFTYSDLSTYLRSVGGRGQHYSADIDVGQFLENKAFGGNALSSYVAGVDTNNSFHTTLYCYTFLYNGNTLGYYIPKKDTAAFEQELSQGPGHKIHVTGISTSQTLETFFHWFDEAPQRIDGKKTPKIYMIHTLVHATPLDFFLKFFGTLALIAFDIVLYIKLQKIFPKTEEHFLEFPSDAFMIHDYKEYKDCSLIVLEEREGEIRNTRKELEFQFKKLQSKFKDSVYFILIAGVFLLIFRQWFLIFPLLFAIFLCFNRAFHLWINTYNGTWNKWKRKFQPYPYEELIQNCDTNLSIFAEIIDNHLKSARRKYQEF